MGRKAKKKHFGSSTSDLATRTSAATAPLEPPSEPGESPDNFVTAAWKAWGGKYGNFPAATKKAVAGSPENSLELPHPDLHEARVATAEPSHLSPKIDSTSMEQDSVAKKQDIKKNPAPAPATLPAPRPPEPPASKGGFLKRLFGGSAKPSGGNGGEGDDPTGPLITLFTGRVKAAVAPEPPKAEPAKAEPIKAESIRETAKESAKQAAPSPVAASADALQKQGELDRLREENAALKKKLEEERQIAQKQLGQIEIQNNELRSAAEKTRGEKGDIEARTAVLRKSVSALERQLADERERFTKELEQAGRQRDTLLQDSAELNKKIAKLEAELEAATSTNARGTSTGLSTEIGASHAHISRLESLVQRLEDEVELQQRELSTEKERFRRNNDEWEEKFKQRERVASKADSERNRIEDSASMLQAAIEALEQQVREQHEAMEIQMKLLDSERAQARGKSSDYEQKLKALEAQLLAEKSRHEPEEETDATLTKMETALTETRTHSVQVEARIAMLEGELEAARNQVLREAEASTTRIKKFEQRWEAIQQQLMPKEEELNTLRPQVNDLKAHVAALEAELKSAKAAVARLAASAEGDGSVRPGGGPMIGMGDPTFKQAGVRLPAEVAEPLYHQTMAPITVMLACADILGMSRKLDPSLKSTADEVKSQTQVLLDLIKSYTLPPDAKTN